MLFELIKKIARRTKMVANQGSSRLTAALFLIIIYSRKIQGPLRKELHDNENYRIL